jgi:hypothetical protein
VGRVTGWLAAGPPNPLENDLNLTIQFLVQVLELSGSLQSPGREPESRQHRHEEQSVPELQPPADGMEELHSMQ